MAAEKAIARGTASKIWEVINLLNVALLRPHQQYCIEFWGSPYQKHNCKLEGVQRVPKLFQGWRDRLNNHEGYET